MSSNKFQNLNSKSQYLNYKQILIYQFSKLQTYLFGTFEFRIWDLGFRISRFALFFLTLVFNMLVFSYAQQEFIYDSKGKRDPFIPLVTTDGRLLKLEEEESKEDLLLEGIIYDKNGLSYAIVNGFVVKISDTVCNYQVLKIEKNKVSFIKGGQITEIELKKEEE
jgi:hypothetical protein